MIAGELEGVVNYNNFLSGKNKTAQSKPKVNLIQKAGKAIDRAGGIESIGRTIDNVRSIFRKSDPATAPPSDFQIGLKQNDATSVSQDEQNKEKQNKEKEKLIIIGIVVVSGIVLVGGLIWYFNNKQRQQVVTPGE